MVGRYRAAKVVLFGNSTNSDLVNYLVQEIMALEELKINTLVWSNAANIETLRGVSFEASIWTSSSGTSSSKGLSDIIKSFFIGLSLIFLRRRTLIHFTSVNIKNFFPLIFARLFGYKVKSTLHDVSPHEGRSYLDYVFNNAVIWLSNEIVLYSAFSKQELEKSRSVVNKRILVRTIGGYDLMYPRVKNLKRNVNLRILFFGRIEPYKGIDIFLELAKANKNYEFVVAGKGTLSDLVRTIDLPNLTFIDRYISDTDIPDFFNGFNYIFLPYRSATQSGVVALAQYFGVYPIVSNVGAFSEQIQNKDHGMVIGVDEWPMVFSFLKGHNFSRQNLIEHAKETESRSCIETIKLEYESIRNVIEQ